MYSYGLQLTEEDKADLVKYLGNSISDSVNFIEKMVL